MIEGSSINGDDAERQMELVEQLVAAHDQGDAVTIEIAYADARDSGLSDPDIAKRLFILDQRDGNGVLLSRALSSAFEDIQKRMEAELQSKSPAD